MLGTNQFDGGEDNDDDEEDADGEDELSHRPKRLKALLGANLYFSRDRIKGTYDSILRSMAYETNCDLAAYLFDEARRSLDSPPMLPGSLPPDEWPGGQVSRPQTAQVTSASTTATNPLHSDIPPNETDIARHPAYRRATQYWTRFPLRPDELPPPEWSLAEEIVALRDRFSAELACRSRSFGGEDREQGDGDDDEHPLSDLDAPDTLEEPLVPLIASTIDIVLWALFEQRQTATAVTASKSKRKRRPPDASAEPSLESSKDVNAIIRRQDVLDVLYNLARRRTTRTATIPTRYVTAPPPHRLAPRRADRPD
jgi:hypothetical protein